jgi:hypothetical protein
MQHYMIKVVSDLQHIGGFLRVIRFPPPIKLTTTKAYKDITNTLLNVALNTITLTIAIHTVNGKMYVEWFKYFI